MKKLSTLFALLILIALTIHAQSWNFTSVKDADIANIQADIAAQKGTWVHNTSDGKDLYGSLTKHEKEAVTANNVELEYTKGLLFTYGSSTGDGTLRIDKGKSRMWFGNGSITIPNLTAGLVVTVNYMSSSKDVARGISVTNLTATSGKFGQNVKGGSSTSDAITSEGTVTADGEVTLTMTSSSETSFGMYIYSIKITDPNNGSGGSDEPTTIVDDYSTTSNSQKNQVILTLTDNAKKFYNTESVQSIDFQDKDVIVKQAIGNYTFSNNVKDISFKKAETIEEGTIENAPGKINITEARGWQESAYVKFDLFESAKSYNVYVKGGQYTDYTKIDEQLVRNYGTYGRADVVGLKADTYSLKVVAVNESKEEIAASANEATNLNVRNYVREGFAFFGRGAGVGAYNNDGTLKANAIVLYITNNNFNTITCDVNTGGKTLETRTGLGDIMQALEKGKETRPFAIRFIGEIKVGSVQAAQLMGDKSCLNLKGKTFGDEQHVTYEGIGDDATMNGIGFRFNRAGSVEVRNLAIMNHADDCFEFTQSVRIWVHNMDLFYGNPGGDADQAKGDGTIDLKKGTRYCTFDNNHFWDCGKASLCGLSGETTADYATYHHNWFDHADSRMPRVRVKTIHIYNNYYDGVSKYGAGSTMGSSLFVERNFFRNTKFPMMISLQGNDVYAGSSKYDPANYGTFSKESGGMIKAYNNVITGETTSYWPYGATTILTKGAMVTAESLGVDTKVHFDCYEVSDPSEKVPSSVTSFNGGNLYNNFDTDNSKMYEYNADDPADVPAAVGSHYGAGRLNHGDFSWTFDNATEDTDYSVNKELKAALNSYKTTFVSIFGDENAISGESGIDDGHSGETGDNGDTTDDGTDDPTDDGDGEIVPAVIVDGIIECSFANGSATNSFFTTAGTKSDYTGSKAITYNGKTYTQAWKLNSSGSITFTTSQAMKMTIGLTTKNTKVGVDGTSYTGTTGTGYYEVIVDSLPAGNHTIARIDGETHVFYIKLEPIN